ncbi:hypothetical protein ACP6JD_002651 [Aspergillus fumigatus]
MKKERQKQEKLPKMLLAIVPIKFRMATIEVTHIFREKDQFSGRSGSSASKSINEQ